MDKYNEYPKFIDSNHYKLENRKLINKKQTSKKQEPTKKSVPAKKNNSAFPIITKKYEGDRYVLQTSKGYYVNDNTFVMRKKDAKMFDSKESAESKRAQFGGKVVKL